MLDLSYMIPDIESEESMIIKYNDKDYSIPEPFTKCFFGAEPTRELQYIIDSVMNLFSSRVSYQVLQLLYMIQS